MRDPVAVIGLGYVGLTLALTFAEEGLPVIGIEKNAAILGNLREGRAPFFEKGLDSLLKKHWGKNLQASRELPHQEIAAYILCIGTPIDDRRRPNLDVAESAVGEIASHLRDGVLVVLRSTVPVGTSRKVFLPLLDATKKKYHYACCPERTCEGIALREIRELPQIIGGRDGESTERASALFRKISPHLVTVPSLEAAEMIKLMDNSWRDTIFAFSNEIAVLCESLELHAADVIRFANVGYDRNTIPQPGFVGGPCLSKDPYILASPSMGPHREMPLIMKARQVNEDLPRLAWERVRSFLEKKKKLTQCKVFLAGMAFKGDPATNDLRGSPSLGFLRYVRESGIASIAAHDFVSSNEEMSRIGVRTTSLEEGFQDADAVCILNNHPSYRSLDILSLLRQMNRPAFFFDAWHLFGAETVKQVVGVSYGGIGF